MIMKMGKEKGSKCIRKKEKERKRERDKRRGSTWRREGEKVPRWNCMRSKRNRIGIGIVI